MKSQELRDLLDPLRADAVRRLAGRLDLGGGTRANLLQAIALRFSRRPRVVFDELRREDLYRCLHEWAGGDDEGEFCLGGLSNATRAELLDAAQHCWIDRWTPARDGEPVRPGSPVVAELLIDRASPPGPPAPASASERDAEGDEGVASGLPSFEEIPTRSESHLAEVGRGLAPFQLDAVAALQRRLEQGRRALLCLPTGGGKTRTALHFLFARFLAQGKKVLWVTHRLDLLDQVHEEVRESAWQLALKRPLVSVSRVRGGDYAPRGDFILASAMTLARNEAVLARLNADPALGVVVYDEAHRIVAPATWRAIDRLLRHHDRELLGLTATPYRTDPQETERLRKVLGPPAYFKSFGDLLRTGFLARPVFLRQMMRSTESLRLDAADIAESRRAGELSPEVLSALARNPRRDEEIVAHWCAGQRRYGKTIAFACDIEHADQLTRAFKRHGVSADSLHSRRSPDERRSVLHRFREGRSQVLVNVGILTEGANVPDTRTVLLGRPTLSQSLYMQMIGRGARGPVTVQGKTEFFVIDCVDNFERHGLVTAGARVAAVLDEAIRESARAEAGEAAPPPIVQVPAARASDRRVITGAALQLLARGFSPSAYTLWGDLRWQGEGGALRTAPVFVETRGQVEAAVQRLGVAVQTRRFERLEEEGVALDRCGALRQVDWNEVVSACRDQGTVPTLVEAPGPWSPDDLALAGDVDVLVRGQPMWGVTEWATFLRGDASWAARLGAVFGTLDACAAVLARTSEEIRASAVEPEPPPIDTMSMRNFARDAADFSAIAHALTWNGESVDPQESQVIATACGLLFGQPSVTPDTWETLDDGPLTEAAARLGADIPSDRGAEIVDHLIRVVLADGQVDARELHILGLVAPLLGVPSGVILDRLGDVDPRDLVEDVERELLDASGRVTCRACSAVLPGDARFCGLCGNRLAAADDIVEVTLAVAADPVAETPVPTVEPVPQEQDEVNAHRRDTSSGYRAEEWLADRLRTRFGKDAVRRNRKGPGGGQSDFVVWAQRAGRDAEFHIELKHAARRNGSIHWSSHQIELARSLPGPGCDYCLVVAHPNDGDGFDLHWCADPLTVFQGAKAKVHRTYVSAHAGQGGPTHWEVAGRDVPSEAIPSVSFVLEMNDACYAGMRSMGVGEDPIEPVIEWWQRVQG